MDFLGVVVAGGLPAQSEVPRGDEWHVAEALKGPFDEFFVQAGEGVAKRRPGSRQIEVGGANAQTIFVHIGHREADGIDLFAASAAQRHKHSVEPIVGGGQATNHVYIHGLQKRFRRIQS